MSAEHTEVIVVWAGTVLLAWLQQEQTEEGRKPLEGFATGFAVLTPLLLPSSVLPDKSHCKSGSHDTEHFHLLCCQPCSALHPPSALLLMNQQVYCTRAKGDSASQAGVRPGFGLIRLWLVRTLLNQHFLCHCVISDLGEPSLFFLVPQTCDLCDTKWL